MSKIVQVLCVPHDPTLPGVVARGADAPEPLRRTVEHFEALRARLAEAGPDVLLVVSGDHFNQWFYDNMPTFSIGKAPRARGPFRHEEELFRVGRYDAALDGDLARHLLRTGMRRGIDFSYSDEFVLDHGFTVPLSFLRPEQDLPVVPVFTNVMAPPVPPGRRFYDLGAAMAEMVDNHPGDLRVAVIASGHLANGVGGPQMIDLVRPDNPWDLKVWEQLTTGDIDALVAESTYESLAAVGSGTPGFLTYVFALGAVGGRAPDLAEKVASTFAPPTGFLAWDTAPAPAGVTAQ